MTIKLKKEASGNKFKAPEGQYIGLIQKVIDKGTQPKIFQGVLSGHARQALIQLELHSLDDASVRSDDGSPFVSTLTIILTANEKGHLIKILKAALGGSRADQILQEGLNLKEIVGKPIMLNIKVREKLGKRYSNPDLSTVAQVPKAIPVPPMIDEAMHFSLDSFDPVIFEGLADKLKEEIQSSPEYKASRVASANDASGGEDTPF